MQQFLTISEIKRAFKLSLVTPLCEPSYTRQMRAGQRHCSATHQMPIIKHRLTTKQFIEMTSEIYGEKLKYSIMGKWLVKIVGIFVPFVKEIIELLYQWEQDYIFDSSKFMKRFPDFKVTSLREGITEIIGEIKAK